MRNVVIEVINEPEWCMGEQGDPCTTEQCVAVADMQRFVARVAAAVHSHGSSMPVTLGSASLKWSGGQYQWWSAAAIQSAYNVDGGTLDFFNVHYYSWMEPYDWDPCGAPSTSTHRDHRTQPSHTAWVRIGASSASYNGLDRPTVFGEIPAVGSCCAVPMRQLQCASENNFWGMLFWPHTSRSRDVDFSEHTSRLRSRR